MFSQPVDVRVEHPPAGRGERVLVVDAVGRHRDVAGVDERVERTVELARFEALVVVRFERELERLAATRFPGEQRQDVATHPTLDVLRHARSFVERPPGVCGPRLDAATFLRERGRPLGFPMPGANGRA